MHIMSVLVPASLPAPSPSHQRGRRVVDRLLLVSLLVHAVVVLIPLAALIVIVGSVWPAARRKLGVLTPLRARKPCGDARSTAARVSTIAIAVVAIGVSVGTTVSVVQVGDSGARAVWSGSGERRPPRSDDVAGSRL